jgi:hypothetical protein
MRQTYEYQDSKFQVSTIPCDDDSVIISVEAFPLGFTMYLTGEDAQRLALQISDAAAEAAITQKEKVK